MRRTYRVPFSRAGLAGLMAALILLCLPGTSIAGGASDTTPALAAGSGLLQYGAGYGNADGAPPVRDVQRALRRLGWQPGPVDGLYGPRTQAAVIRFQTAARVAADGIVGRRTRRALTGAQNEPLRRGAGFTQPDGSPRVRTIQVGLQRRGLRPGPVDGLFGPRTQAAVERLQRSGRVPVSGVVTTRTRQLLSERSRERARRSAAGQAGPQGPAPASANLAEPQAGRHPTNHDGSNQAGGDSGDVGVPIAS